MMPQLRKPAQRWLDVSHHVLRQSFHETNFVANGLHTAWSLANVTVLQSQAHAFCVNLQ